jgi:amino acid transporter
VIFGFDTASTLSEETRNPRSEAPKAVLGSVIGAFVIGVVFLWGTLMAIPDLKEAIAGFFGPPAIIASVTRQWVATVYLLVVAAAIFVCCMSILTSTIRLAFGMSRDNQLPLSSWMSKVNPKLHTPIGACIGVGLLAALPFIQFAGATIIAVAATAMIYLSYFLGNLAVMRARTRGWPRTRAPFALGAWGKVVNVVALLWGGSMLINLLTPAPGNTAWPFDRLRIFTNPTAQQSDYLEQGKQLVNFHVGFLNKIPLIELVMIVVIVVGAIYYLAVQRGKPFTPVVPPDEDVRPVAGVSA